MTKNPWDPDDCSLLDESLRSYDQGLLEGLLRCEFRDDLAPEADFALLEDLLRQEFRARNSHDPNGRKI